MMTKGRLFFLSAFLAAMAGMVGFKAANSGQDSAAHPARTTVANEFKGMTLQIHSPEEAQIATKLIDEIARTKVNTLSLVLAGYQECANSTSIFIDIRRVPTDDQLRKLIRYAHDKGLHVTLMPIVLLENPRDGEWRGKINPEGGRWDDWWERYTNFILHYARIAADTDVELFAVGSELISTEQQTDRWKALIEKVRNMPFRGRLTYSANWDHYKVPQFWDKLDIIGMTTYYELTGGKQPTEDVLLASWNRIKKEILDWQAKSKNPRPLLFTEVGWPNQKTAAEFPWDYYRAQDKPDPEPPGQVLQDLLRGLGQRARRRRLPHLGMAHRPGPGHLAHERHRLRAYGQTRDEGHRRFLRQPRARQPPDQRPAQGAKVR